MGSREAFLEATKAAREARRAEKDKGKAVVKLQAACRGWLVRSRMVLEARAAWTRKRPGPEVLAELHRDARLFLWACCNRGRNRPQVLQKPAKESPDDMDLFETLCRAVLATLEDDDDGTRKGGPAGYTSLARIRGSGDSDPGGAQQKDRLLGFIWHLKCLCGVAALSLDPRATGLKPSTSRGQRVASTALRLLLALTATSIWLEGVKKQQAQALAPGLRQLCHNLLGHLVHSRDLLGQIRALLLPLLSQEGGLRVARKGTTATTTLAAAAVNLAIRPVAAAEESDKLVSLFVLKILSIPALVRHLEDGGLQPEVLMQRDLVWKCFRFLAQDEVRLRAHFDALEGSYALCLAANLTHLLVLAGAQRGAAGSDDVEDGEAEEALALDLDLAVSVLTQLLRSCGQYVSAKQSSSLSHWHPVLGWFSVSLDSFLQDSMGLVKEQLALLWNPPGPCLDLLFRPLARLCQKLPPLLPGVDPETLLDDQGRRCPRRDRDSDQMDPGMASNVKQMLRKAVEKTRSSIAAAASPTSASSASTAASSSTSSGWDSYLEGASSGGGGSSVKLGSIEVQRVARVCQMYQVALKTLAQLRLEILSGLCYRDVLVPRLFRLLQCLGPVLGIGAFLERLAAEAAGTQAGSRHREVPAELELLRLFADCLLYLVTILDDVEMYEKQTPLALAHYVTVTGFLNAFLFRVLWTGLVAADPADDPVFQSLHLLLEALHRRDSRKPFTKAGHWLMAKDVRAPALMADLDRARKPAQLVLELLPHIIPHADRVLLFRRKVAADRVALGLIGGSGRASSLFGGTYLAQTSSSPTTLVTIHRARIVEDGYRQLASLSPASLKGVIRVKFVNAQGLDEAGIDQDGVFKEFLEENIKKVFDPGLNLFCATGEGRLYPSPLSHLTENHLALFEYVGKMIGKAVYEGIVVDVPFAAFFVSQVLGKDQATAFYSYIDELSSLDAELYRNLTYLKYYPGDASDLGLTFSVDQDVLGRIVTHELVHGGKGLAVTNDNRIAYMHAVAQFRMRTQIREQTAAFARGFRSIVATEWLAVFSAPEVVRLIAGDNSPMDLKDLRKHTNYYGGFHDAHRVINWLWDILERDFDAKERAAFLKFVTSCSKPPLLGFQHLEPPFSIRCVEVSDDEDDGDTVGSVLRGFISLRRKDPVNRLPTASTCFNLLKLPNYQKKSTLRDKLRYAVMSNTGFELS